MNKMGGMDEVADLREWQKKKEGGRRGEKRDSRTKLTAFLSSRALSLLSPRDSRLRSGEFGFSIFLFTSPIAKLYLNLIMKYFIPAPAWTHPRLIPPLTTLIMPFRLHQLIFAQARCI